MRTDERGLQVALRAADFAVVRGDRFDHFRIPLGRGLPYLLIGHDLATMRDSGSPAAAAEREMIEGAAAVLFATRPLAEYAAARYRLPHHDVVPLRPRAADLRFSPLPKRRRTLVYAGGTAPMHQAATPWGYRANVDIFRAAIRGGWEVHVYPSRVRPGVNREYADAGCVVHAPVPERHLPEELSQYSAGLQVFNTAGVPADAVAYARLAWPNKAWQYLAAGIPTVGCNPGFEAARIYEGRWGIVLDGPEALERLTPHDLPLVSDGDRRREVIDRDAPRLAALLRAVTGRPD